MLKKTLAIFLSFALFTANAQALDFSNTRGNVTLKSIKQGLVNADKSKTCLDEYMARDRTLTLRTGLGTGIGLPLVGAPGVVTLGAALSGAMWIVSPLFIGPGAALIAIPTMLSGISGIQLGQNRYVMRLVAQSYEGEGKRLDWFHKRIKNKYRRKFGKRIDDLSKQELASKIVRLDRSGALCDGTLTGKTGKLKKRLARPKHLRKYLYKNL